MKTSKFSEAQIFTILKEGESGVPVAEHILEQDSEHEHMPDFAVSFEP